MINNPQTDLAVDEKDMISGYLKQGGHVLILTGYTESGNPNLSSLCADYGLELKNGYVADTAPGQYYNNNPFLFFPEYEFSGGMLTGITSKDPALLLNPSGMTVSENLRDGLTVAPFLTTTDSGIFVDPATQEQTPEPMCWEPPPRSRPQLPKIPRPPRPPRLRPSPRTVKRLRKPP